MKTIATVISVSGERATVAVERSSACASCPSSAGCVGCAQTVTSEVQNDIGARAGDRVELLSPTAGINALSILTFFVPVALPLLGYAAAAQLWGDTVGYVAMAALLVLSICGAVALDRFWLRGRTMARIVRIIEK